MNTTQKGAILLAIAALFGIAKTVHSDSSANIKGTQSIYGNIPPDQIEFLSTGDRIKTVAASGSMMEIWETLEHGERVECLDCIPAVEPLLYDSNPRTREIAAWWLRRRVFGVFGPGEVYERTLKTLATNGDAKKRAYAAYALGEFLVAPGAEACATAIATDKDAAVREAAVSALGRMNMDVNGALAKALTDVEPKVKLAAIKSAGRINSFTDSTTVASLLADGDATVRKRAAELLEKSKPASAVPALLTVAKSDSDAGARNAACHALGVIRDASARATLEEVAKNDTNGLVRDQAQIALRRL